MRVIGLIVLVLATAAVSAAYALHQYEIDRLRAQLAAQSQVAATPQGDVEFAAWGEGPPVLVIHGAGGGYDQGRAVAAAFGGDGFRWIAPSRFGYLRSTLPSDASTAAQADAFAALLDLQGVDRTAIVAISGGAPPALQFALRYPERTSALVLISSAPYTPLTAEQQDLPLPAWAYQALFSSNFPYWIMQHTARAPLDAIFDVKPPMRARLTQDEAAFVARMVDSFQPVTDRTRGLANEGAAIDPAATYALERIAAPTLVIHARDDGINPFAFGRYTAERIPGAAFMPLDDGGHLLLGRHSDVRSRVSAFLRAHGSGLPHAAPTLRSRHE
ncbi:MAG: alpha/beta hydrolase [Hyphomonadaceae bacterium]|nr:alpha/beta hydrolase [Hyphomonadaceae bacterium]